MTTTKPRHRKPSPKNPQRPLRDPKGGLTAAGRTAFNKKDGSHLRPGVKGRADTPEKMRRKGSFLRRHFATLRGPLKDADGNPTRLALQAHAWGEPVPKTAAAARRLAAKGTELLKQYAERKPTGSPARRAPATKVAAKKKATKARTTTKSSASKKKKKSRTNPANKKRKKTRAPIRKAKTTRRKIAKPRKKAAKRRKKSPTTKPGLYANIRKAQARAAHGGRPVRKKGEKGAPTANAFKKAKKTAKA